MNNTLNRQPAIQRLASQSVSVLMLLIVLTILMRLPALGSRPLWYDEAFSVLFARQGPAAMLEGTLTQVDGAAADVHPLLYYSILWGWMNLFGESPIAVRSLSVFIGVLLLIVNIRLGHELFNRKVGNLFGLLYAIAPFQIHYGQEARMYVLLALFSAMATLALVRGLQRQSRTYCLLFGLIAAMAMYTHILAFFYLLPLALILVIQHRSQLSIVNASLGIGLGSALYLPWLLQIPGQITKVQQSYWIERPGGTELIQTILGFLVDLPIEPLWLGPALLLSFWVLVVVSIEAVRIFKEQPSERKGGLLILSLLSLPVMLLFLISQLQPIYILRGLLPSGLIYLLVLAWVIARGKKLGSSILIAGLGAGFLLGNLQHLGYSAFPYASFDSLNRHLRDELEPGMLILHTNKLSMLPAYLNAPELPHIYLQDPPSSGADTLAVPTQRVLGLLAHDDVIEAVSEAPVIIVIMFKQEMDDYSRLGIYEHPAMTTLASRYETKAQSEWGDLLVFTLEWR